MWDIVRMVAKEHGLPVQIEKIGNTDRIAEFGVLLTPALVIDGDVKSSGRVPSPAEVLTWLKKTGGKRRSVDLTDHLPLSTRPAATPCHHKPWSYQGPNAGPRPRLCCIARLEQNIGEAVPSLSTVFGYLPEPMTTHRFC